MHPTHPEASVSTKLDLAGLWLCTVCSHVHSEPACPPSARRPIEDPAHPDPGVRLCACCARVAVPSGSPFASFYCATCGPRIVEINRSLGRLAIPVCRDPQANRALLPTPGEAAPDAAGGRSFLGSQLRQVELAGISRAHFLLDRLRLPIEPIPLERYLREVVQLRHESFHAEAALKDLINWFHEYVVELPSESPALLARVKQTARGFARGFRRAAAEQLRAQGPAQLREAAWGWIRREQIEVQQLPPCIPQDDMTVQTRMGKTRIALVREAVREFERVFGRAKRPRAPAMPPRFAVCVLATPGEEWPDDLPRACPESAHVVVGLEGAPAWPDMPLAVYHLSMDRRHRLWILWGQEVDEEHYVTPAPVAWCPRSGLAAREAGFLLLELSLQKDRETYGADRPRPQFGMPGLLDEDLTDVLLDLVWETT